MKPLMILATVLLAASVSAEPPPPPPAPPGRSPLAALSFLIGVWQAAGAGEPGRSVGEFSFQWAADRHALIRNNEALTSSSRHSDVMLIYAAAADTIRAVYTDSEGHTIDYRATVLPDQQRVVFESAGAGPRFRLWYQLAQDSTLATGFQIAPPGSSEFKTYLEGVAHHK